MEKDKRVRQLQGESSAKAGHFIFPHTVSQIHAAAILALAAAVFLAVYLLVGLGGGTTHQEPSFLTNALGAPHRSASLVRKPAPDVRVTIGRMAGTRSPAAARR